MCDLFLSLAGVLTRLHARVGLTAKGDATVLGGSTSGGQPERVVEIGLTDDEGGADAVASYGTAEENDAPRHSDGTVESSPAGELDRVESQTNATYSALGSNPKIRPIAEDPSRDVGLFVEGRRDGDVGSTTNGLTCADTALDEPGGHGIPTSVPHPPSIQPLDPSLAAIPPDEVFGLHENAEQDQIRSDDGLDGGVAVADGPLHAALPDRSTHSSPRECSLQGLFLPDTSGVPFTPLVRGVSIPTSTPPPSSASTDERRSPRPADNFSQNVRNGETPPGNKSTHTTITIP